MKRTTKMYIKDPSKSPVEAEKFLNQFIIRGLGIIIEDCFIGGTKEYPTNCGPRLYELDPKEAAIQREINKKYGISDEEYDRYNTPKTIKTINTLDYSHIYFGNKQDLDCFIKTIKDIGFSHDKISEWNINDRKAFINRIPNEDMIEITQLAYSAYQMPNRKLKERFFQTASRSGLQPLSRIAIAIEADDPRYILFPDDPAYNVDIYLYTKIYEGEKGTIWSVVEHAQMAIDNNDLDGFCKEGIYYCKFNNFILWQKDALNYIF